MSVRVALFVPCYVNHFYPHAAMATLHLLERFGYEVVYPTQQSCCGQPFANSGLEEETRRFASRFVEIFDGYDYIVAPGASCVAMVKRRYPELLPPSAQLSRIVDRIYDITEFLHDIVRPDSFGVSFPHKVGLHQSCHGLRELHLGTPSELALPASSKAKRLLELVEEIELVELERPDECCGFGGTFSIHEPQLSIRMGEERVADHERAGAEYITGFDLSCLMHMEGIIRARKGALKVVHLAEILAGTCR